jgi:hypothetical protein
MRRTTNNRRSELPKYHDSFGLPIKDVEADSESCEVDAVGDRKFLSAHPPVRAPLRPISAREVQATGLQKDQVVVVAHLNNRGIVRQFTLG